ncbi:hypothetical protein ABFS82_02G021700 [Erythranthe guttata]|uniref:DUF4408 domain-containing protein n=1 Tax=Erythranthe guttata TaxID=4155 RepID=A0A022RCM2_ERYGU|nr:PREDICTED: uncharacterized protein LOC105957666 [Erythranthe guttata]EYU37814.1 hypothetical protein MIMGU_mgv1a023908mg [Erythranthe guttata]|eukprot:XP_012837069.1 PREDICTED: uncharacterized protein LOC105957666 [Erythranthe guttata]
MDSVKFQNVKSEKANAISRHRRTQKLTTLFRLVELFVFLVVVSRFSSQFAFSFNISGEYFRGISVTLISPRFVFLVGNTIIVILFLLSSSKGGENEKRPTDFYDEYVEKCRNNNQQITHSKHVKKSAPEAYEFHNANKIISKSKSEINLERRGAVVVKGEESHRDLRRSMSQSCRKSVDCGRKKAAAVVVEDEMSGEEFRRTVEAFIARQQRVLREEEEEFTALVSV